MTNLLLLSGSSDAPPFRDVALDRAIFFAAGEELCLVGEVWSVNHLAAPPPPATIAPFFRGGGESFNLWQFIRRSKVL